MNTHLFGEDVVGEEDHAGGAGDEEGDRLHDVPGKHIPANTSTHLDQKTPECSELCVSGLCVFITR